MYEALTFRSEFKTLPMSNLLEVSTVIRVLVLIPNRTHFVFVGFKYVDEALTLRSELKTLPTRYLLQVPAVARVLVLLLVPVPIPNGGVRVRVRVKG